ncbi:hypothetical protein TNCV_4272181 [Trichonephila clavipes]|nr:hypothetical protein TNCV_4272181 [Trichonephila clavipes]
MDICKCIVPSRYKSTLNSRRATSREVSERGREVGGLLLLKIRIETSQIVMVLKATANDKRTIQPSALMNFVGRDLAPSDRRRQRQHTYPKECYDISNQERTTRTGVASSEVVHYQNFFGAFFGYGSPVNGTVVTHVVAPLAWGPRIIDTAVALGTTLGQLTRRNS